MFYPSPKKYSQPKLCQKPQVATNFPISKTPLNWSFTKSAPPMSRKNSQQNTFVLKFPWALLTFTENILSFRRNPFQGIFGSVFQKFFREKIWSFGNKATSFNNIDSCWRKRYLTNFRNIDPMFQVGLFLVAIGISGQYPWPRPAQTIEAVEVFFPQNSGEFHVKTDPVPIAITIYSCCFITDLILSGNSRMKTYWIRFSNSPKKHESYHIYLTFSFQQTEPTKKKRRPLET